MIVIEIDRLGNAAFELIRAALSEETTEKRLQALEDVHACQIADAFQWLDHNYQIFEPKADNLELLGMHASHASIASDAEFEVANLLHRYKSRERRLNIAEEVGRHIVSSIQDGTFRGVGSPTGIFRVVCRIGRNERIHGAQDHDTVRSHWQTYKGVVHLGMAMNYVEENPDQGFDVFRLAETFRTCLSENGPRNTKGPYVERGGQISFVLNE